MCFGIKAQAQSAILGYDQKLSKLSELEASNLNYLANGAPTSMFVTVGNEAKIHQGNTQEVVEMSIEKTSDFTKLSEFYSNKFSEVVLINIIWNGKEQILMSEDLMIQFKNLKYIYIRSYRGLDKEVIQAEFFDLLQKLKEKKDVEILYSTMEQPS